MNEQQVQTLIIKLQAVLREFPEFAEDETLRADMFEAETELHDVMIDLIRAAEDHRALRDGTREQLARLKARADRFDHKIDYIRALMSAILETADLRKMQLAEATVFLRSNPQQIVGEINPDALPDNLVTIIRKPDKDKIKKALLAGEAIEGLQLSNSPPSIVVTVK